MDTRTLLIGIGKATLTTTIVILLVGIAMWILGGEPKEIAKTLGSSVGLIILLFVGMVSIFYKTGSPPTTNL